MGKSLFCCIIVTAVLLGFTALLMGQDRGDKDTGEEKKEKVRVVELEEVVVTATRTEKKLTDVTASITVISAGEIEGRKAETVSELLRDVPGVFVRQEGPTGSRTSVLLRGTHPTQTLVLIDGIEVNDPNLGGAFDLSDLDTSNIERIEVVRGSQSALYGSSAVGGVINIITKKGKGEPKLSIEAWGGSFDHARVQVAGSGATDKSWWSFAAVDFSTNNNMPHNSHSRQGFLSKFGTTLNEDMEFELLARVTQSERESPYDFESPLPLDKNISNSRDQAVVGARFTHKVNESVSYHLKSSFFNVNNFFQNKGDNPGDIDEFTSTAEATVSALNGQVMLDLGRMIASEKVKDEFIVGAEIKKIVSLNFTDSPFSSGLAFEDTTENKAIYIQNELKLFDAFTVTIGARADKYGSLETKYLPRAGLSYKHTPTHTTLKANYGKGFRTPSMIEFYDPLCGGNPNLVPEDSESHDIGAEQSILKGKIKFEATYFRIDVNDLIAYSLTTWQLENINKARMEGVEFAFKWVPTENLKFGLTYTYQNPRDRSGKFKLPFRSPHFGGFEIVYTPNKFSFALTGFFSEAIPPEGVLNEKGNPQPDAGNVKLVNLAAAYEIRENAKLLIKVTNLLDERYKESQRAPKVPGIGAFVGVSAEF